MVTFEIRVCSLAFDIFLHMLILLSISFGSLADEPDQLAVNEGLTPGDRSFASLIGLLAKDWKQESSLLWNQWGIPKKAAVPC